MLEAGSPYFAAESLEGNARPEPTVGSMVGLALTSGSQKRTSAEPAALADLSVAAKARHSIWHAGVISSPFQHEGTRKPAAVHPGHLLQTIQYLSGHSKTRWVRDGKAAAMLHWQDLPTGGEARPKLLPTMSWDKGLATKGGNV